MQTKRVADKLAMQKIKRSDALSIQTGVERFAHSFRSMIDAGIFDSQVVQYSPHDGIDQVMGLKTSRAGLVHVRFPHEACVRTEQRRNHVSFTLPLIPADDWLVNGQPGRKSTLFLNYGLDETQIYTPQRNLLAGGIEINFFLRILGSLGSFEPDEADIPQGAFTISPTEHQNAAKSFLKALYEWRMTEDGAGLETRLACTLAKLILSLSPPKRSRSKQARRAYDVFKAAQTHLLHRIEYAADLDELCRVAGVSAPTLTSAYKKVTAQSPMRYIRQMRLEQARELLASRSCCSSSVKDVAFGAGFTQMGRFSHLFKTTYGVLPSHLLSGGRTF